MDYDLVAHLADTDYNDGPVVDNDYEEYENKRWESRTFGQSFPLPRCTTFWDLNNEQINNVVDTKFHSNIGPQGSEKSISLVLLNSFYVDPKTDLHADSQKDHYWHSNMNPSVFLLAKLIRHGDTNDHRK